jgi:ribosomal protein L14
VIHWGGRMADVLQPVTNEQQLAQKLRNKARSTSKVQKGEVHKAIVLRTKAKTVKKDGTTFFFQSNVVGLINKQGKPIASRIIGPIPKFLKKKKNLKFVTLSSGFI